MCYLYTCVSTTYGEVGACSEKKGRRDSALTHRKTNCGKDTVRSSQRCWWWCITLALKGLRGKVPLVYSLSLRAGVILLVPT